MPPSLETRGRDQCQLYLHKSLYQELTKFCLVLWLTIWQYWMTEADPWGSYSINIKLLSVNNNNWHKVYCYRFDNIQSLYCEDVSSGRLSVVLPVSHLNETSCCLIKFMCLGSDVGGPNRRPLQVIFTLEDQTQHVHGRDIIDIKICCCPKRDKAADEKRYVSLSIQNVERNEMR